MGPTPKGLAQDAPLDWIGVLKFVDQGRVVAGRHGSQKGSALPKGVHSRIKGLQ